MRGSHPVPGQVGYVQIPAVDLARSAAFYAGVFGWSVEAAGGFTAPGMIGQLTTDLPVGAGGPLLWIWAEAIFPTLAAVEAHCGRVHGRPERDGDERWLVQVDDPAGNRVGIVFPVRSPDGEAYEPGT